MTLNSGATTPNLQIPGRPDLRLTASSVPATPELVFFTITNISASRVLLPILNFTALQTMQLKDRRVIINGQAILFCRNGIPALDPGQSASLTIELPNASFPAAIEVNQVRLPSSEEAKLSALTFLSAELTGLPTIGEVSSRLDALFANASAFVETNSGLVPFNIGESAIVGNDFAEMLTSIRTDPQLSLLPGYVEARQAWLAQNPPPFQIPSNLQAQITFAAPSAPVANGFVGPPNCNSPDCEALRQYNIPPEDLGDLDAWVQIFFRSFFVDWFGPEVTTAWVDGYLAGTCDTHYTTSYTDGSQVVEGTTLAQGFKRAFETKKLVGQVMGIARDIVQDLVNKGDITCAPVEYDLRELIEIIGNRGDGFLNLLARNVLQFGDPLTIPGNMAGGVGAYQLGPNGSCIGDDRNISGRIKVIPLPASPCSRGVSYKIKPVNFQIEVKDALDFCPGFLGDGLLTRPITESLQLLEAKCFAGAFPFTVTYYPPVKDKFAFNPKLKCKDGCCLDFLLLKYKYECGDEVIERFAPSLVKSGNCPTVGSPNGPGGPGGPGGLGGLGGPGLFGGYYFESNSCVPQVTSAQTIINGNSMASSKTSAAATLEDGVCARVKLRLDQDAVVSRDGFRATLEIINLSGSALQNVAISVLPKNSSLQLQTDLFFIQPPSVHNIDNVNGGGIVASETTASASWVILTTSNAAPVSPLQYFIGGYIRYTQDGLEVNIPLADVPITVYPAPKLSLQYFHQRDVFSDDPFTDVIEPSIPYSLAVMVKNSGYGVAKNFHITSAQPKIVENEKGLLIDFKLIATEVAGQNLVPSLTASFGDINPGQISIGRWLFTSTLQGLFIDYSATFEHIDGLGNPKFSLLDSVDIHEMIHLVQAPGALEDGKPDFLVNDIPDLDDLPDTLYLSNGSTNPVQVLQQATTDGPASSAHLVVQLTSAMPGGWTYLRVPDPGAGQFTLQSVVRSDGTNIYLNTNVWTTDRTFISLGLRPIRENILHLLDYNSTGSYTLTYEPGSGVVFNDTNAPSSTVSNLPPASRPYFQVRWSGRDEGQLGQAVAGIAYYDIFVSENNGAFVPWLQQTHLVSATYIGANGSQYAFYSVATDANGNRESAPATPDATTFVSISNSPPSITISNFVTINEGDTFDLPFTVADPDTNQVLTVALLIGAPPGVVLNAAARRLTWPTGEGNGPSSNLITLVVRDDDFPSLSATGRVTVVVREVNSPPSLTTITNRTINEGRLLTFAVSASDNDLPRQTLAFLLGAGVPAGATLDGTNGVFSWRPTELQGGTTNRIAVIVRDSGTPPLSATQTFSVVVRDTQGDFTFTIGSTNLFMGESNSVPLGFNSGVELTNLSFTLGADAARLGSLSLGELAPLIRSSTLEPAGTNRWQVRLTTAAEDGLIGAFTLARLHFAALSNTNSAIVPLLASNVTGTLPNGTPLTNPRLGDGRVFVIGAEPILDAGLDTNGVRTLVLYGRTNQHYTIQARTNVAGPGAWTAWRELDLFTPSQRIENVEHVGPQVFYRAATSGRSLPKLAVRQEAGHMIIEWPTVAGNCVVLEAGSLGPSQTWIPVAQAPQIVGENLRLMVPVAGGSRFYRLRCAD